jgi:hypothetical protein
VTMPSTNWDGCPRFAIAYLGRICSFRMLLAGLSATLAGKIIERSSGFARSFSAQVRYGEPGAPVHFLPLWFEWKSTEWRVR